MTLAKGVFACVPETRPGFGLVDRVHLPRDLASLNVTLHKKFYEKKSSQKERKAWELWLRGENGWQGGNGIPDLQKDKKRIVVVARILYGRMQKFEKVNLYGAAKPLEDALVNLGWLKDDSEKYCELFVEQYTLSNWGFSKSWADEIRATKTKVIVEIWEEVEVFGVFGRYWTRPERKGIGMPVAEDDV